MYKWRVRVVRQQQVEVIVEAANAIQAQDLAKQYADWSKITSEINAYNTALVDAPEPVAKKPQRRVKVAE